VLPEIVTGPDGMSVFETELLEPCEERCPDLRMLILEDDDGLGPNILMDEVYSVNEQNRTCKLLGQVQTLVKGICGLGK